MHRAKIQRDPSGKILGVCASIPSEYLDGIGDKEYVNMTITMHEHHTDIRMVAADEPCDEGGDESWN